MPANIATERIASENAEVDHSADLPPGADDKDTPYGIHLEKVAQSEDNLVYNNIDEEPELHARTWVAVASVIMVYFVGVIALQAPPAVVSG